MEQQKLVNQDTKKIQKLCLVEPKTDSTIHDAQYDYYGKRLATGSSDGIITIYDVSKHDQALKLVTFKAHNGAIWQVSWGHPRFGNIIASCGFDKKVAIWKEVKQNEWQEIISNKEHKGSVNGIAWGPWESGLQLAACSSDGFVSIMARKNDDTWDKIQTFEAHEMGVTAISWALLSNQEDVFNLFNDQINTQEKCQAKLATCSCDNTVKIWKQDLQKNEFQLIKSFCEHTKWVRDVAWNPNANQEFDFVASCSEDETVIIRKLDKKTHNLINFQILKFEGPAWHVSWSQQGTLLAVSSASATSENINSVFQENSQGQWEVLQYIETPEVQQQI